MTFEASIEIFAPPADLFDLTQDYRRRLAWDPFLQSAELVSGATTPGVGVRAYCSAHNGLGMETEYVSYTPPDVAAVKMTRGPRVLKTFAGSWRFKELAPNHTRVTFRYHLLTNPAWMSWLLTPVVGWVFHRETKRRLAALKSAAEADTMVRDGLASPTRPMTDADWAEIRRRVG